ncbi:MAG: hypothetical protein LBF12_00545 [Christensenellaceae bacterium]|jgi:hypothetical protein|nr:hypothetical protein [Christensenellaceae bacterium]
MRNQFKSSSVFRSQDADPQCETKPYKYQNQYFNAKTEIKNSTKNFISILLILFATLLLLGFCLIALYAPDNSLTEVTIKVENNTCKIRFNDLTSVGDAEESGDFSNLKGTDIFSIISRPAMFATFNVKTEDENVAIYKNGILYGLRIGATQAIVLANDGREVGTFNIEVTDEKGRLYYDVTFLDAKGEGSNVVYKILSGKTLKESELLLPLLPTKPGYNATEWQLNNVKFDLNVVIKDDHVIKPVWSETSVILTSSSIELNGTYGSWFESDLKEYVNDKHDKNRFIFTIDNTEKLPDELNWSQDGLLQGSPVTLNIDNGTNLPFVFLVKITDSANMNTNTLEVRFLVEKRTISAIFIEGDSLVYNGDDQTIDAALVGVADADLEAVAPLIGYSKSGISPPTNSVLHAGTYVATINGLMGTKSDYYTLKDVVTKTFSVAPTQATLVFTNIHGEQISSFETQYIGGFVDVYGKVVNLYPGDECEVIMSYSDMPVEVGVYTAHIESITNPNYYIENNNQSCTITIIRANLNIECDNFQISYGTSRQGIYYTFYLDYYSPLETPEMINVLNQYVINEALDECGEYYWTLDPNIEKEQTEGVFRNFTIKSIKPGLFTVVRRSVTIRSLEGMSFKKEYDGNAFLYPLSLEATYDVQTDEKDENGILITETEIGFHIIIIIGGEENPQINVGVYKDYELYVEGEKTFLNNYIFSLPVWYTIEIQKRIISQNSHLVGVEVRSKTLAELGQIFSSEALLYLNDPAVDNLAIDVVNYDARFNFDGYSSENLPEVGQYEVRIRLVLSEADSKNFEFKFLVEIGEDEIEYTEYFTAYGYVTE